MIHAGGSTGATAVVAAANVSSSYRVKFRREQFLELVKIAKPKTIYHKKRIHFFAHDGFVMYTFECKNNDFKLLRIPLLEAIEFSNTPWNE